jgi:hypothetical protein
MKKAAFVVLIFTMILFLVNPLSGYARGGHGGGHWGWGGWWPWAVVGGAVLAPYYYGRYYSPYYDPYYFAPPTVVVQEPAPVYVQPKPTTPPPSPQRIFIYPRQGQSEQQLANDRYECHRWAVGQTGYDPTLPSSGAPEAAHPQNRADYHRALGACLDGRGYTMR